MASRTGFVIFLGVFFFVFKMRRFGSPEDQKTTATVKTPSRGLYEGYQNTWDLFKGLLGLGA